jgi:hypothetical protein
MSEFTVGRFGKPRQAEVARNVPTLTPVTFGLRETTDSKCRFGAQRMVSATGGS